MTTIQLNSNKIVRDMKLMNAVNNGPTRPRKTQSRGNFDTFSAAGFPYVRTHDSNLCTTYGAPHTIDVTALFPNFDADENDPASYDFVLSDEYIQTILASGSKVFYRLGQSIEHAKKKYGVFPPKDFGKWARICEHIILHFNEGWADGFHYNIEYWEIWNEPDLNYENYETSPTWQGTQAQFFDLYEIAAKHLKAKFPHLKIGGPAIAWDRLWAEKFLAEMKRRDAPVDFFSWHRYSRNPRHVGEACDFFRELLDRIGYPEAESILNEWNYVKNWDTEFVYSLRAAMGIKGASFATAVICVCQDKPLDMLMYYDARIGTPFNGLFDIVSLEPGKTYHPYFAFHKMYQLKNEVETVCENPNVYALAVSDGKQTRLLVTYYNDDDSLPDEDVELKFTSESAGEMRFYLTDKEQDNALVRTVKVTEGEQTVKLSMKLFDVYHIVLE